MELLSTNCKRKYPIIPWVFGFIAHDYALQGGRVHDCRVLGRTALSGLALKKRTAKAGSFTKPKDHWGSYFYKLSN